MLYEDKTYNRNVLLICPDHPKTNALSNLNENPQPQEHLLEQFQSQTTYQKHLLEQTQSQQNYQTCVACFALICLALPGFAVLALLACNVLELCTT